MRARLAAAAVTLLAVAGYTVAQPWQRAAVAGGVNATFSDTFERADGAVGNGWTALRGTWAIQSGSVVAGGDPERLLAQTADVGPAYTASTSLTLTPVAAGHAWSGVAANIVHHSGGTQSFYVLRVGQNLSEASSQPPQAPWQLLRIDHSAAAGGAALLADGAVSAAAGSRLDLSIQMTGGSTMVARITGGAAPITRTVALRTIDRLASGKAGVYSQSGANPLHDFSLQTTADAGYVTFADDFQRANGTVLNGWAKGRGSWTIAGGTVIPSGDSERLMYHGGVTLGGSFTAGVSLRLPSPAAATRSWTGVAVNIAVHSNGTQTFYALRVAQDSAFGNKAPWQVVKVTNSAPAVLLKGGEVSAAPGSNLNLTLTSRNRGTGLEVGITGAGVVPVNDFVSLPVGTALSGGRVGVYNNAGSQGVDDFSVTATRAPNPPSAPLPALNCQVGLPADYPLPPVGNVIDPQVVTVDSTWAGHPVGQAIVTSGSDQYVAYYDAQRRMTVAKRVLPATTWTRKTLDSTLGWDSHNYVTMALDSDGHLHVSGNMHNVPLVYFRTTRAGDVTSLVRVANMVNPGLEQAVTYPRFVRDATGALLFNYRDGASGNGATYYLKYQPATRSWSAFLSTPFSDGQGLRNGYDTGFVRGPDGYYHLGVVWRDTGDAGTSSMPTYLRSADLLRWQDSAGNPVPLPATYDTADLIDRVPIYGGLVNGNLRIGFDGAGRVMMTYAKYDENLSNQIYVARPDGAGNWTHTKLTNFTGQWFISGGGTLNFQLSVLSGGSVLPDGKLRFDYRCQGASRALIVDPATMTAIADVPRPALPAQITDVRSTFGGMQVNTASSGGAEGTYLLRWESKVSNQDQPRPPSDTPPAQPLQIYLLR